MVRVYIHVVLLLTTVLVDCKKKKKDDSESSLSEEDVSYASTETLKSHLLFDLTGDFMKQFTIQAASLNPTKSIVCSPLSALLPLGKLIFGASGRTLEELYRTIGVSNIDQVKERFKAILESLRKLPGVTLSVASRVYVNMDNKLNHEFSHQARKVFHSGVESINMKDPFGVAQIINNWVRSQTNGMISNVIDNTDISPNMNLVVVNAVHFKGQWKDPFEYVKPGTFYGTAGEVSVPMMHVTNIFNYTESSTLGAKVILIPYKYSKAMMMIVLPNSKTGLPLMINELRLAPKLLNTIELKKTRLHLTVPKFSIQSELDLVELYKKVGLKEIFSEYSGFDEIVTDKKVKKVKGKKKKHDEETEEEKEKVKVKIDGAKQKAMIEVTEEGTTASAASTTFTAKNQEIQSFEANRPFLYFIIAEHQQLFAGTFTAA